MAANGTSLVDTNGLILAVKVHSAALPDREGGKVLLAASGVQERFPRLQVIWADLGYQGRFVDWVHATTGWKVEMVKHSWAGARDFWVRPGQEPPPIPTGFVVLKRRWVVERTFAWLVGIGV